MKKQQFRQTKKPPELSEWKTKELDRDKKLMCILWCRHCGAWNEINKKYDFHWCINPKCNKNIIYYCLINHKNVKEVYRKSNWSGDNVHTFYSWK